MNNIYDFAYLCKANKNRLKSSTVNLTVDGWASTVPYSQTVQVQGVTATNIIIVAPEPTQENIEVTGDCKVMATEQNTNELTFTAFDGKPSIALNFHVLVGGEG